MSRFANQCKFLYTQTYRLSLSIFGPSSTLMICATVPNFNLLVNQNAVCHYGQVKKKNQMFLVSISIEKKVCRSFFISGN